MEDVLVYFYCEYCRTGQRERAIEEEADEMRDDEDETKTLP